MASAEQLITEHLDTWSSTIKAKSSAGRGGGKKQELYGIKKLRALILELAVHGLLVPQDANDEPASDLLKRIAQEKAQLVKEGKIKKPKKLPPIADGEVSFETPNGWVWHRLHEICEYIQRGKGPKYADQGQVQVVSQKCIQWSGFDLAKSRKVEDSSLDKYQGERFLKSNDLLWNSTGTGTAGRINRIDNIAPRTLVADSHVTVIRTLLEDSSFTCNYLSSAGIQNRIEPTHQNSLVSGTTNQVELNTSAVTNLPTPLPPLAEQHRIVAKVDELMALCDQLEQQQTDSIAAHETLVTALLGALTAANEQEQFEFAWQRIAANFDSLFTTESSIDQLKQTILQLAVMGKLVPQDPNDEPAAELLKKIATEKAKLIKEKKIKKQKDLPEISKNEILFRQPTGWEWCHLKDIAGFENGDRSSRYPTKEDFVEKGIPFFGAPDIRNGKLTYNPDLRFISETKFSELTNGKLLNLDFIMLLRGSVGKVAQFHKNDDNQTGFINAQMLIIRMIDTKCCSYLYRYMTSVLFKKCITDEKSGAVIQQIPASKIAALKIPLPPRDEQQRIVAKVDELISLCDALKAKLKSAQSTQLNLADTLVEKAIS